MGKNIVVFADGTGQEGGLENNTNVYDLFNMIEDRTKRQVSFYGRGLGTGRRKITGLIGGAGISENFLQSYEFIANCYQSGDQIYLFGFSRGATTVRTLAGFINRFGILPKSRPELIKQAYKIYQLSDDKKRRQREKEFIELNHTMWARVKFLGVWDTVAALGFPIKPVAAVIDKFWRHSFHDLRLRKSVDFARHAIAIDDERLTFHPTLWDETAEKEEDSPPTPQFSADHIADIYLVATKLKAGADPVSKRVLERGLTFPETDTTKLKRFAKKFEKYVVERDKESPVEQDKVFDFVKGQLLEKGLTFSETDTPKLKRFAAKIDKYVVERDKEFPVEQDKVFDFFKGQLSPEEEKVLKDDEASPAQRRTAVCKVLNRIIRADCIYSVERFEGITLRDETKKLLALSKTKEGRRGNHSAHLNRLLLEDAFPEIPRLSEKDLFNPTTYKLLNSFDRDGRRREQAENIQTLTMALVEVFNQAIEGTSLYDPVDAPRFAGMELSETTKKEIELNERDKASIQRLNRLLLEDAFSLRPANPPRIKQVWFPGMHTDVGGGYAENELARIPLIWMVKEAMDVGLLIYPNHRVDLRPDAAGRMHNSREGWGRLYRKCPRFWDANKNQGKLPLVHESVTIRAASESGPYKPWILKMKYKTESWPKRLMSSVQYDDYFVWREGMWGFDAAFAVPWSAVKRVHDDELRGTITIEVEEDEKTSFVIEGSLSRDMRDRLWSAFDRQRLKRENERQDREDERQRKEDERQQKEDARLNAIVKKHTEKLEEHDNLLFQQMKDQQEEDERQRREDERQRMMDDQHWSELSELKSKFSELEKNVDAIKALIAPPAESAKRQSRSAK